MTEAREPISIPVAKAGPAPVRVVVVDDQYLVRAGLRALLERGDEVRVVGEAASGEAGVAVTVAERPDVVLMDIRMPGTDGIEATRRIVADPRLADVRVVVLTTFDADEHIFEALRSGASGFLLKDTEPDELRRAVRVVAQGEALLSPSVTRRVVAALSQPRVVPVGVERLDGLTDREREVLAEVGRGRSNDEIAGRLSMRPATARTHVSRIMTKLGARDRAQLVVVAYETGLVSAAG
jgi:DNA-binding NarL/FixJ family response regulator